MTRPKTLLPALLVAASVAVFASCAGGTSRSRPEVAHTSRTMAAASCRVRGTGTLVAPDNACTPGSYAHLSVAAACAHKIRPQLPPADHQKILAEYGVPGWTGRDGELDHRVPFFLGGRTNESNIWPERGGIPNPKDQLEFYVYRRVCQDHSMRPGAARRLFLGDWRVAYRRYIS